MSWLSRVNLYIYFRSKHLNVMQQNRILLRIEERLITMEKTEEKMTGDEDGGRQGEAIDVPIFDAMAEDEDDGEDEENRENRENEEEEVEEGAGKEVEK